RHAQSYNAGRLAVLRDRLHQHDAQHVALLAVAGRDLDALHAQAGLAVGRRDDAPIERELLLLGLELRFELRQRHLELRVRLLVDLARRLEHRELPLELLDPLRLLPDPGAEPLDLVTVVEQRVARLVAAELEHEVGGSEHEHGREADEPGARASHRSRPSSVITRVLSQWPIAGNGTRFTGRVNRARTRAASGAATTPAAPEDRCAGTRADRARRVLGHTRAA